MGNDLNSSLDFSVEGLDKLDLIMKSENFRDLKILNLNINLLTSLNGIERFCQLRVLNAADNKLSNITGLGELRMLEVLNLDRNSLTCLEEISSLSNLVQLKACSNKINKFPLLKSNFLEKLELYHNDISDIPMICLQSIPSITHLDVGRNKIKDIVEGTIQCPFLTHLILSQNFLEEVPRNLSLPFLKCLWLGGNKISTLNGWVSTADGKSNCFLPAIEKLYINDNTVKKISSAVVKDFPRLRLVDISFNNLCDVNIADCFRFCTQIYSLNVQDNEMFSTYSYNLIEAVVNGFILDSSCAVREISSVSYPSRSSCYGEYVYSPLTTKLIEVFLITNWKSLTDFKRKMWLMRFLCGKWNEGLVVSHLSSVLETTNWVSNYTEILPKRLNNERLGFEVLHFDVASQCIEQNAYIDAPSRWDAQFFLDCADNDPLYEISLCKSSTKEHCLLGEVTGLFVHVHDRCIRRFINEYVDHGYECNRTLTEATNITEEHSDEYDLKDGDIYFCVKIQSIFRGFSLRKKLREIQTNVRYVDEEIESMVKSEFSEVIGSDLNENWISYQENSERFMKFSIAYGDHIRRRSSIEATDFCGTSVQSTNVVDLLSRNLSLALDKDHEVMKQDVNTHMIDNSGQHIRVEDDPPVTKINENHMFSNNEHKIKALNTSNDSNKPLKTNGSMMRRRQRRKKLLPAWMQLSSDDCRNDF